MYYTVEIKGIRALIMHNGTAGLDTRSPAKIEMAEITKKRGSNRTVADDARLRQLECQTALWLDESGSPTIPGGAVRAVIETGARKLRQGPQVREGLIVDSIDEFIYDKKKLGTTVSELGKSAQLTLAVVVERKRILRTRAKFDTWGLRFTVEVDDELVDKQQLATWLDIGGRRIGIGDWRPERSGTYGRFEVVSIGETKRK
ncbi:MAG: hypothetical protein OXJ90_14335 [Spirochaetaceae bacterium]|nr:hypothetical protein [Spirochaetaceae bacterium]